MKSTIRQQIYAEQARAAAETNERVHTFYMMLQAIMARQQYREEKRASAELGFDLVDLGGES